MSIYNDNAIHVPQVTENVRYGQDPLHDRITPDEHTKLVRHLLRLISTGESARQLRNGHMAAVEMDLLGFVKPDGSDCDRKEKREEGEGVSIPDAIYPFGWVALQNLASEIMRIVFPAEAPYAVVASAEKQALAQALTKAFRGQGVRFAHRSNIAAAVFDQLALDLGALEFRWTKQSDGRTLQTPLNQNVVGPGEHAGMAIKALNPYNIAWDSSCEVADLPINGEFFAHFDRVSAFRVARENQHLNFLGPKIIDNLRKWVEPQDRHGYDGYELIDTVGGVLRQTTNWFYHEPRVAASRAEVLRQHGTNRTSGATDFSDMLSTGTTLNAVDGAVLHKTVIYARIRPGAWGLGPRVKKAELATQPYAIWEFHIYGPGYLGYAAPIATMMDRFPVSLGTMNYRRHFGRAFKIGEHVAQMGLYGSTLLNLHKRALRKGVEGGLTLYNPNVFDLASLKDTAGGRIPASQLRHDDDIRRHIMQLSDLPDTKNSLSQAEAMNGLLSTLLPTNSQPAMMGLDRATQYQAQAVMATSNAALLSYAGPVDDQLLIPARLHMHRLNLQNAPQLTYVDEAKRQLITVAADEMTNAEFELVQSQPLMGIDRMRLETLLRDMLNILMQTGGQLPPVAAFLMKHYMQSAGIVVDMDEYLQAAQAEEAAFAAAQAAAADDTNSPPTQP